jgi:hypothetical protein
MTGMRKFYALGLCLSALVILGVLSAWLSMPSDSLADLVSGVVLLGASYMGGNVGEHAMRAWANRAPAPAGLAPPADP